MASSKLPITL